jgi:hypothetical protein
MYSDHASSLPLARSGAAATAILILFTLHNFENDVFRSQTKAQVYFKKKVSGLQLTGAESMRRINEKILKNSEHVSKVAFRLNALSLALATLVWGFGDLARSYL